MAGYYLASVCGVLMLSVASGCATAQEKTPPDPPSLEERSSMRTMLTIRGQQIREFVTPRPHPQTCGGAK